MTVSAATFALGALYNILQTVITGIMSPQHSSLLAFRLRIAICVFSVVSVALSEYICYQLIQLLFRKPNDKYDLDLCNHAADEVT